MPIDSFSIASSSGFSNSSIGIGGWVGPRERRGAAVVRAAEAAEVEDRALADLRVELRLLARGLRRLEHGEHALAGRAGRAEGAALDQRLDRLLVHGAAVDALAEVPQRGELAVLRAPP